MSPSASAFFAARQPSVPPLHARHVLEAHLAEELRRAKRSKATLADQVQRTVARHLAQTRSKIGLRQIPGSGHVTARELLRLSYIEQHHFRRASFQLVLVHLTHRGEWT